MKMLFFIYKNYILRLINFYKIKKIKKIFKKSLQFFLYRFILNAIKTVLKKGGRKMFVILSIIFVIYILLILKKKLYTDIYVGTNRTMFYLPFNIKKQQRIF